jgi:uncharacterized protein (UPF0262 family)
VPEADLYASFDQLRGIGAKILSVTPLRPTLEDYFLSLVENRKAASHAFEVSTP